MLYLIVYLLIAWTVGAVLAFMELKESGGRRIGDFVVVFSALWPAFLFVIVLYSLFQFIPSFLARQIYKLLKGK